METEFICETAGHPRKTAGGIAQTKALVSKPDELMNWISVTWKSPLKSEAYNSVEFLLGDCWLAVSLLWPVLPGGWMLLGFVCVRKALSASCNSVLCELLHPSAWHFLDWGHCRNVCLSRKHKKRSLLSTINLALSVGTFLLKTRYSRSRWSPLHTVNQD